MVWKLTITIVLLVSVSSVVGRFQQSQTYPLNPEASKTFQELNNQEQEIVRRANEALQQLEAQKQMLLIGANVPRADLAKIECKADGAIVVCSLRPEPKASPSPKS